MKVKDLIKKVEELETRLSELEGLGVRFSALNELYNGLNKEVEELLEWKRQYITKATDEYRLPRLSTK